MHRLILCDTSNMTLDSISSIDKDTAVQSVELCAARDHFILGRKYALVIKVLAALLFIFAWTRTQLDRGHVWSGSTLFGGSFWTEFSVYAGVAMSFPIFSLIGTIREGSLVSQVWFEVTWMLGVVGFDIFLIYRLRQGWPPFRYWEYNISDDPYVTVGLILYVMAVLALGLDLTSSFMWGGLLLGLGLWSCQNRHDIWILQASDFLWLQGSHGDVHLPSATNLILGIPRPHRGFTSILEASWKWTMSLAVFKRCEGAETAPFCLFRGFLGLIIWAIIVGYGALNCMINPVTQFDGPKGLPMNLLPRDAFETSITGRVAGFIRMDTVSAAPSYTGFENEKLPLSICEPIKNGMRVSYTSPLSQEVVECDVTCRGTPFWSNDKRWIEYDAVWDCGPVWNNIPFRLGASKMDTTPFIFVTWNSSSYMASPSQTFTSGLSSILTSRPDRMPVKSILSGYTPNETPIPGNTFNFTAGRVISVEVGRRQVYKRKGTFRELLGYSEDPAVYLTYPAVSVRSVGISPDPQMASLMFYPEFGPFTDDIYEEYLNYTILGGLSKTGGLYTAFDLIFSFFFGRSLLSILWGGKFMTPFGVLGTMVRGGHFRKKLCKLYAGIESSDPGRRAEATCNFLHDFILDLKPLKIKETSEIEDNILSAVKEKKEPEDVGPQPDSETGQVTGHPR